MKRSKPCSITDYDEAVAAGIIGEPPSSEQCLHEFVTIDSAGQSACRWCAKLFNFRLAGLGDLLAVIHGDGGHYLAEHGAEKAVADAIDKYNRLLVELDHLQYADRKRTQDAEQTVDDDAPDASEQLRTSNQRDIVAELRAVTQPQTDDYLRGPWLYLRAADEIERLRDVIVTMLNCGPFQPGWIMEKIRDAVPADQPTVTPDKS